MPGSPLDRHDAILLDLDGVVYRGDRVLPGVPEAVHAIRERVPLLFLTNNSGRTPHDVADRLRAMGVPAQPEEVLTSALATAAMLRREGHSGRTAFVIGERGIREALAGAGVRIVDGHADRADLVVVGWDRTADYAKLRTAALLVQRGARLIATNPDTSYPAPDGLWPGAGALLAAVTTTTGADPQIVGKPMRPMFDAAVEATGARDPLMVGDRLDTDVGGAAALGWETLLVFSGASGPQDLTSAEVLPTYVGEGLPAVLEPRVAGRFRRTEPRDVAGLRALLEAAGLGAGDVEGRLDGTVLCEDPERAGDGRVAATACLVDLEGAAVLRSVAVRDDLRGQGLGTLAVAAALRRPDRSRGGPPPPVHLTTETAPAFFSRLGFRAVAAGDVPTSVRALADEQGCTTAATFMVLDGPNRSALTR